MFGPCFENVVSFQPKARSEAFAVANCKTRRHKMKATQTFRSKGSKKTFIWLIAES